MKRIAITMILLATFFGTLLAFQTAQAANVPPASAVVETVIQTDIGQETTHIANSAYRLAYHSRMIVLETLIITKKSINLVLDTVIDAL